MLKECRRDMWTILMKTVVRANEKTYMACELPIPSNGKLTQWQSGCLALSALTGWMFVGLHQVEGSIPLLSIFFFALFCFRALLYSYNKQLFCFTATDMVWSLDRLNT